jgi:hypothetical protein
VFDLLQNKKDIPLQFSTIEELGTWVVQFPASRNKILLPAFFSIFFLLNSLTLLGIGISISYQQVVQHGLAMLDNLFFLPGMGAILAFLLSAWMAWIAITRKGISAAVYQNGFAFNSHKGLQSHSWLEVASLRMNVTRHECMGILARTTHVYTIECRNGGRLVFNDVISRVEELFGMIEESTLPNMCSLASQSFNAGQELHFGNVHLDRVRGIRVGKNQFPWKQVGWVDVCRGVMQIARKDGTFIKTTRIPVAAIPNFRLLCTILNPLVGVQSRNA